MAEEPKKLTQEERIAELEKTMQAFIFEYKRHGHCGDKLCMRLE